MRRNHLIPLPVLAVLAVSCTPTIVAREIRILDDVRVSVDDEPVGSGYSPDSKLFRIAVIDFVDQTHNNAGMVEDMFADVLTTELYKTERFTLYDRAQLKRKNITKLNEQSVGVAQPMNNGQQQGYPQQQQVPVAGTPAVSGTMQTGRENDETQAENQMRQLSYEVDGILLGFVTNAEMAPDKKSGVYTIDYRIVKHVGSGQDASHAAGSRSGATGSESILVIFADSDRVKFTGDPMAVRAGATGNAPVTLDRDDLKQIANKVRLFFPNLAEPKYRNATVTDINGRTVSINLGQADIKPGNSFFVTTAPDEQTGEFSYKAKFIVRDTFEHASRAVLSDELDENLLRQVKVGDRIVLK